MCLTTKRSELNVNVSYIVVENHQMYLHFISTEMILALCEALSVGFKIF